MLVILTATSTTGNNEKGVYFCVWMLNGLQSTVVLNCLPCLYSLLPLPTLVFFLVHLPAFSCSVCDSILWLKLCVGPRHC
jgi:hypothetical protein